MSARIRHQIEAKEREMRSCYPLLVLMACGITHASPDVRAFEFAQGVIVDPLHTVAYMSSAQAKIDAVSLSNGEVIATSTRWAKPLLLYDNVLVASAQDRDDVLSIVGLRTNDLKPKFEVDLSLPSGVGTGSFYTGARIAGDEIIVQWRSIRRPFTAIPTHEPAVVATGFARIGSATGRLIGAGEGEPPVAPKSQVEIPTAVRKLADEGSLASPLCHVDHLVAALQYIEENGQKRIVLRRWRKDTGESMPTEQLFDSQFTFRSFSRDCRHLLASKAADGWIWQIYSTTTGQQIAEIHHSLPGPEFFVSNGDLIYEAPAAGVSVAGRITIESPRLVAIKLSNGQEAWARPIGEAAQVGPFPSNPSGQSTGR